MHTTPLRIATLSVLVVLGACSANAWLKSVSQASGGIAITGYVVADSTGEPLAEAQVIVSRTERFVTRSDGQFVATNLIPGTYLILVRRLGYETRRDTVLVTAGVTTRHDFRLKQGPTLDVSNLCACDPIGIVAIDVILLPTRRHPSAWLRGAISRCRLTV